MTPIERYRKRIEASVRTMKGLYSVVAGLALSAGILEIVDTTVDTATGQTSVAVDYYPGLVWLLALVATIIPFHHGALRHMDDVYIYPSEEDKEPKEGALLVDYLILFFEAGILFYLAQVIRFFELFVKAYLLLLFLDVFWALAVHFLTSNFPIVKKWMFINIGFGIAILIVYLTPLLDVSDRPPAVLVLIFVRSIVDYGVNWHFYFPQRPELEPSNVRDANGDSQLLEAGTDH